MKSRTGGARPSGAFPRNTRLVALTRLAVFVSVLVILLRTATSPDHRAESSHSDVLFYALVMTASIALAFDAGRTRARGWGVVAWCLLVWTVGAVLRGVANEVGSSTLAFAADVPLTVRALLAVTGTMMLVSAWTAGIQRTVLLNGLTVATAATAAATSLAEAFLAPRSLDTVSTVLLVAYPVLDVFVVALVIGTATALGARVNRSFATASVGIVLFTATDILHVLQYAGSVHATTGAQDAGWVASMAVVALASHAGQPRDSLDVTVAKTAITLTPTLGIFASIGVILVDREAVLSHLIASASIVLGTLRTIGLLHDVGALHREVSASKAETERRSETDELTGLANRRGFVRLAEEAIAEGGPIAFLGLDLNGFKLVNDTYGHAIGDELLRGAARRIRESVPDDAIPGRVGGDEFVVVLTGASAAEAERVAWELHSHVTGDPVVRTPDGVDLRVFVSIGVSRLDEGVDFDELLHRGDVAMYKAKQNDLGVAVWSSEATVRTTSRSRVLADLRGAVERRELDLHYQPKLSLDGSIIHGVEALVRWRHREHGYVPPDEFVPYAESTSLIHELTDYVLEEAVRQAREWLDAGHPTVVAVNLSGKSVRNDAIVDTVATLLMRHELPPRLLELEVTETAIITEPVRSRAVLEQLRELGVRLSLDDFGAGYTSLSHLKTLPFDVLKVDKSIVENAATDRSSGVILSSIIALGDDLGLEVVAEGVEDAATLTFLATTACDSVQGWVYSKALPAAELRAWVDSRHTATK